MPPTVFRVGTTSRLNEKSSVKALIAQLESRSLYVSFKKNPKWVFQKTRDKTAWQGLEDETMDPMIRGKTFTTLENIQSCCDPDSEFDVSSFFLSDKTERIIVNISMATLYPSRSRKSKPLKVPSSDEEDDEKEEESKTTAPTQSRIDASDPDTQKKRKSSTIVTTTKKRPKSTEVISEEVQKKRKKNTKPSPQLKPSVPHDSLSAEARQYERIEEVKIAVPELKPRVETDDVIPPQASLCSIFKSTETIEQRYKPSPKLVSKVNSYDQFNESFLCRQWLTDEEIASTNTKWNPISSCYSIFYYASKILNWPLEEVRVVVNYDINAVKLTSIIPQIYKLYKIENRLAESTILTKLLVYCIASMNSFGIIRPIIFKGTSSQSHQIEKLCASKQTYERIIYHVTWPWRVSNNKVYVLSNQTKLNEIPLKTTFLSDLQHDKNMKKLLKNIPDWVYGLTKQ
jgi:hypothetical protein